ncbi:hypothetical protein RhiJN_07382 [Ceratobasidium sp. AG-Ba]|nr:hypothetical protein RhiJN_07382 [Ceratobasidium sp. AG-Ba]QRW08236.1 hypothetical protein RhiLY_07235 [Ceratobasidium sp. AG-Ba]
MLAGLEDAKSLASRPQQRLHELHEDRDMPHCDICHVEQLDLTAHYTRDHPQLVYPRPRWDQTPNELSNEPASSESEDDGSFCFQCSRQFDSPAILRAHLSDAQVHGRTGYSGRSSRTLSGPYYSSSLGHQVGHGPGRAEFTHSGRASESNYPTGSSSDNPPVSQHRGLAFGDREPGSSNDSQYGFSEQTWAATQQEGSYIQASSEYESSANSHEGMDTDTDGDDGGSIDQDSAGMNRTETSNVIAHNTGGQYRTQYHDAHEYTTLNRDSQISYTASIQHIPVHPGLHSASSEYSPSRTHSFSQERKSGEEAYCNRCSTSHNNSSLNCEVRIFKVGGPIVYALFVVIL